MAGESKSATRANAARRDCTGGDDPSRMRQLLPIFHSGDPARLQAGLLLLAMLHDRGPGELLGMAVACEVSEQEMREMVSKLSEAYLVSCDCHVQGKGTSTTVRLTREGVALITTLCDMVQAEIEAGEAGEGLGA